MVQRAEATRRDGLGQIGRTLLLVLMFGGAIRSKGVLREMATRPAAADDEPGSAMELELLALAHRAAGESPARSLRGSADRAARACARLGTAASAGRR